MQYVLYGRVAKSSRVGGGATSKSSTGPSMVACASVRTSGLVILAQVSNVCTTVYTCVLTYVLT